MGNNVMRVELIEEAGYKAAMSGLSLSYGQSISRMGDISKRLSDKDGGHNKFLESMVVWLMVEAPRYWWQQADTYRIASKQSESTMHTITRNKLTKDNFEPDGITPGCLRDLNKLIAEKYFHKLKQRLPESFIQKREWCLSYKTLRNIILQRSGHKLEHWSMFISQVLQLVSHSELLPGGAGEAQKTQGDFVYIGFKTSIDKTMWRVHKFLGDKVVVLNESGEPPYSMIISEEDFIQTRLL